MDSFLVAFPPGSALDSTSLGGFQPNVHTVIPESVWVIGTTECKTGFDVGEKMGIGPTGGPNATAVILRIGDYNGFAQMSLWEKLPLVRHIEVIYSCN